MRKRTVRPLTVAVLAATALSGTGAAAAAAPAPTCGGKAVTVRGTDRPETLRGTAGRDVIDARGGHDRVLGLGGDDIICGAGGNDLVDAGAGDDRVLGGDGDDRLLGGAGRDDVDGGAGDDSLDGGAGSDALRGGAGADRLSGGGEADRLDGGAGSDVLGGGAGDDHLDGGRGGARDRDRVTAGAGRNTVVARPGDTVTDRRAGDSVVRLPSRAATPPRPSAPPVTAPRPPAPAPPAAVPPVQQPPVEQPPVEQPPVQQPVEQPPVEQPPVQPKPPSQEQPASTGTLTGHVTRTGLTAGALGGITVTVHDSFWNTVGTAVTDGTGAYTVPVPAGTYVIEFVDVEGDSVDAWNGGASEYRFAEPIAVAVGATVVEDVQLEQGFPVSGTVRDAAGAGVAGMRVQAWSEELGGEYGLSTTTAADGTWTVHGAPAGTYHVRVDSGTSQYQYATYTEGAVSVRNSVDGIDVTVVRGHTARGTVVDATGAPVPDAYVQAMMMNVTTSATTDAQGRYELAGLADAAFTMNVQAPGYTTRSYRDELEFTVSGADVAVPVYDMGERQVVGPTTSVSGRVLVDGIGIGGVEVSAGGARELTAADGTFRLAEVAQTATALTVEDYFFGRVVATSVALDASAGPVSGLEVAASPGRVVGGVVTTPAGPLGVRRGTVEVLTLTGEVLGTTQVDHGGRWAVRGLPDTEVLVRAHTRPGYDDPLFAQEYFGETLERSAATRVQTGPQRRTDVHIALDPSLRTALTISGTETVPVGGWAYLQGRLRNQAGEELLTRDVSFTVDDADLAEITPFGSLRAKAPGVVTVTARWGDLTATRTVTISGPGAP